MFSAPFLGCPKPRRAEETNDPSLVSHIQDEDLLWNEVLPSDLATQQTDHPPMELKEAVEDEPMNEKEKDEIEAPLLSAHQTSQGKREKTDLQGGL